MLDEETAAEDAEAQEMLAEAAADEGGEDGQEPFDEARAKAKIAKVNAEAANLRKRLKELEPLAAKAKELEDAGKSETQREREAREAAEKRADEAEAKLLRAEVAAEKGLTAKQARRLAGTTREELEADADELRQDLGLDKSNADESGNGDRRRPVERLLPGASNEDDQVEDPDKLAEAVLRKKSGF